LQKYIYNVKCIVEYDGTRYAGFQIQPNADTIEAHLIEVLSLITKDEIKIYGSGRTDKGVHAKGQVFNFYTNKKIPAERFIYAINNQLPLDIRIKKLNYVKMDFHSRFSAKKKEYRYFIKTKDFNAFDVNYMDYQKNLDVNLMKNALKLLVGTHNFKGFCSVDVHPLKDFVKTIFEAELVEHRNKLEFRFQGTGFLKYQIRRMMALIIAIGKHEEEEKTIIDILEKKDPFIFTKVANPCGLYLWHVYY